MTLGMADGTNEFGLNLSNLTNVPNVLFGRGSINVPIGTGLTDYVATIRNVQTGITTDPTKSGIICDNDLNIKYVIKY